MSTEKFQNKYRIPSARAAWHDYSGGAYFVTICTACREHYFGKIANYGRDAKFCVSTVNTDTEPQMQLSEIGMVANDCMQQIHTHFQHVDVPLYVIMPNHIHAIIIINELDIVDSKSVGQFAETQNFASLQLIQSTSSQNKFGPQSKNLASVIRGYKIGVTKYAHQHAIPFAWQTRFHDRIIRDQNEINRIAEYIKTNVAKWDLDCFYSDEK